MIMTVCDNAAGESCPVWPGRPITVHWGIEHPAAIECERQRAAFEQAMRCLQNRISLLLTLPVDSIDNLALRASLREIGAGEGAISPAREKAE